MLKKGIYVKHPHFGKGVVSKLEGDGVKMKATIIFEGLGIKKILVQYAKLEIL